MRGYLGRILAIPRMMRGLFTALRYRRRRPHHVSTPGGPTTAAPATLLRMGGVHRSSLAFVTVSGRGVAILDDGHPVDHPVEGVVVGTADGTPAPALRALLLQRCRTATTLTPEDLGLDHVVVRYRSGARVLLGARDNILPALVRR